MATLDYIDVPPGATQLLSSPNQGNSSGNDIRPAPRITTSIPHPSPPPSPTSSRTRRPSLLSSTATSLTSPTLSFIPQLLLSASLPGGAPTSSSSSTTTGGASGAAGNVTSSPVAMTPTLGNPPNPRRKLKYEPENVTLLSSRDPLSLPIMSTNFKRFVSIVGPVFWLQDRVEEVLLWKRGWMRTGVWMAAYALLCFYPRMILLLPHLILIGVILATYPYHKDPASSTPSIYNIESDSEALPSTTSAAAEGSVPWQANIQGIQNLMGAVADAHALIEPYVHHLILTPQHLAPRPSSTSFSSSHSHTRTQSQSSSANTSTTNSQPPPPPSNSSSRFPYSPYPPHILTLLVLSFVPLLFIIHLPAFPIREVCLVGGLVPFMLCHPWVRQALPYVLAWAGKEGWPLLLRQYGMLKRNGTGLVGRLPWMRAAAVENENEKRGLLEKEGGEQRREGPEEPPPPLPTLLQRIIDDDRLTDDVWNAEMREVQLWENERWAGALPPSSPAFAAVSSPYGSGSPSGSGAGGGAGKKPPGYGYGWNKAHLRPGERAGWTRGRDGWSGGAGAGDGVDGVDVGSGEVSSNLTFSLAPGWRFVETEDWRKDLQGAWSGCGGDPDGWVYTNDAWLGPRPAPYTSGGGSVTRRRRWVRRVWYDAKWAGEG